MEKQNSNMSNEMCEELKCGECGKGCKSIHPKWHETKMYNIPTGATKLILGSMPPRKLCINKETGERFEENDRDVFYFYGSDKNCFWQILSILDGMKNEKTKEYQQILTDILNSYQKELDIDEEAEKRRKFLENLNIGIGDIYKECKHGPEGYLDKNIENWVFQDELLHCSQCPHKFRKIPHLQQLERFGREKTDLDARNKTSF